MSYEISYFTGPVLLSMAMIGFWFSTVLVRKDLRTQTVEASIQDVSEHHKLLKKMDDATYKDVKQKLKMKSKKNKSNNSGT
ncbi:hypothetical protein GOP56_05485 [Brevibacillus sp. 7WMA2]|uniref:hypothetical protein n=1 Tax=Brevibacillus TaxID=55080 RepID=UPI00024045A6|nr:MULTISPECIES: hypothetical protein [Brevibacillus]AUM65324.1 hypothetical protein C0R09_12770 [Brevibacillus laterosporus]AYK08333.1 hypothetical protein D8Z77_19305 [Brevibacillus laterosporus]ERM18832.1 hypothetical protein P615_00770 [Brevibacillus laterosporus PE36]MBA4534534.1 hypothetical protein [Brevibacillus halotolerans]MCR8964661.1 hypothetical protein [Brevibacillus laterosporus]